MPMNKKNGQIRRFFHAPPSLRSNSEFPFKLENSTMVHFGIWQTGASDMTTLLKRVDGAKCRVHSLTRAGGFY